MRLKLHAWESCAFSVPTEHFLKKIIILPQKQLLKLQI